MYLLTKSKFLIGLKCLRHLWTVFHEPDKLPENSVSAKFRMEQGNLVGELAKKCFPEGINLPTNFKENLTTTKKSLGNVLFEAGFLVDNLFARVDILIPNNDSFDIVEVKSGTRVKNENLYDVAFQKFVLEKSGLKIKNCFLMHVNNEFIKKGEINPEHFFVKKNINEELNEISEKIQELIDKMKNVISKKTPPNINIKNGCSNKTNCPCEACWNFLHEGHVLELYRGGQKSLDLLNEDVLQLIDIPNNIPLDFKQEIQVDCAKNNKSHINVKNINMFLQKLKEPVYYLDFETFMLAIPVFENTGPYQKIPFQYSLHVEKEGKIEHFEFLARTGDQRKEFLEHLKKVLGEKGSIIVYNQSFEKGALKELAESFSEYKEWVEKVNKRVVDLLVPFRNFDYYNPKQHGSASIKAVLPAITGKSYEGLEIADGDTASISFLEKGEDEIIRKHLLEYCKLDTEAMVWIVKELRKSVNK